MSNKYVQDQTVYFRLGEGKPEGFAKVTGIQGFVVILQPVEKVPDYDFTHIYVIDSQIGEPPKAVEAEPVVEVAPTVVDASTRKTMTPWQDIVNGIYELAAGVFLFLNCIRLYKDKEVKGWSILSQAFFTSWSYWNLYYYPYLGQRVSFFSFAVMAANTLWTILAIHYTRKNKKKRKKKKILHG